MNNIALENASRIRTFVFSDIVGSSTFWEDYSTDFKPLLDQYIALLREAASLYRGYEVKYLGDSLHHSFELASEAILYSVKVQQDVECRSWIVNRTLANGVSQQIDFKVRIGMHTCESVEVIQPKGSLDYDGSGVNRAARIASAAHGWQILVSNVTKTLATPQLPVDITFQNLGSHSLRNMESNQERLWQVSGRGLRTDFPPPKTVSPDNLPEPMTRFIGHSNDLSKCLDILSDSTTRVLTVTGAGGIGKTRFAIELSRLCKEKFSDGVWWVPLENDSTGDEMLRRIGEQLKLNLSPPPTEEEHVWNYHRERNLLLLLDNLEQIAPRGTAAKVIMGLLSAGPRVKCLVTSRIPLNLHNGEVPFRIEPLPPTEAENLFVERARKNDPQLVFDSNDGAIREICRVLDGIPLCIELAAARILLQDPSGILADLQDRLGELTTDSPDVHERHQTIRKTIKWSYDLLSEDARALLVQLSVFTGGFTFEAVKAVCSCDNLRKSFEEIHRSSLLQNAMSMEGAQRSFFLLGVVRDFAFELCADESIGQRHATYFLSFLRMRLKRLRTQNEKATLNELESNFDNLQTAVNWLESSDDEKFVEMAALFSQPLCLRGRWTDASELIDRGLRISSREGKSPSVWLPNLHHQAASLAISLGETSRAYDYAQQSLNAFLPTGDKDAFADAHNLLGFILTNMSETASDNNSIEEAKPLLEQAEEHLNQSLTLGDRNAHASRGIVLHNLAKVAALRQQNEQAWALYSQCLEERRLAGDMRGEAKTLSNMGVLAIGEGDRVRAYGLFVRSLQASRALRDIEDIAITLNNIADLEDDPERSITFLVHAQRMFHELRSAYEKEPEKELRKMRHDLGKERYDTIRAQVESSSWEELIEVSNSID